MIKTTNLLSLLFTILTNVIFAQHKNPNQGEIEKILTSTKIEFMGSSMVLTQESKTALLKTVKSLNAFPNNKYRIIGYAPKKGDIILKQILSENRASQVKNILISEGIDASLLTTKGVVGIKEKKKQAKKTRTPFSYIDFELIEKTPKKSLKNNSQTKPVSTNNLKRNNKALIHYKKDEKKIETKNNSKKSLENYLILRSELSAIKQEKDNQIKQNQLHEKERLQKAKIKNQKSKSRINVFFSMNQITFQENSSVLNDEAKRVLQKTAEFILYYSNFKYNIIGYSDKNDTEAQNISLSKNRAIAVRNFLVNKGGVYPSILFVIAKSYSKSDKSLNQSVIFSLAE